MPLVVRRNSSRLARFLLVALLASLAAWAVVDTIAPELMYGSGEAAAEVSLRVVPRLTPTADSVRRRVLTTEQLRDVVARLKQSSPSIIPAEANDEIIFERWRRLLAVEVRAGSDAQHIRVRFLAPTAGRVRESSALVETIAAQYAGELAAERWYAAVDRLRAAEQISDAACDDLIAQIRGLAPPARAAWINSTQLGAVEATRSYETAAQPADRELLRLIRVRAQLLENLQPAHPQVQAVDARLNALQLAGAGTHIRRMSGEEELSLPNFPSLVSPSEAAPLKTAPTAPSVADAVSLPTDDLIRRWQEARAGVQSCLDDLLTPASAEFPVVSTVVSGLQLWGLRNFWRLAAVMLGFVVGLIAVTPWRKSSSAVAPVSPIESKPTEPMVPTEPVAAPINSPAAITNPKPESPPSPVAVEPIDDRIHTLDQARAAAGGQLLGTLVRRRDPIGA